jgi:hypothetical protein
MLVACQSFAAGLAISPRETSREVIQQPEVKIIDSKDDPRYIFIVIGNCTTKVLKKNLKTQPNNVIDFVLDKCLGNVE